MFSLTIETNPNVEFAKTRRFSAVCLCYVCADHMWDGGYGADSQKIRPVYMVLGGKETTLRPFVANLRLGRKAEADNRGGSKFEIMKSAPYRVVWQRHADGAAVATLYLPDLFVLDPGMVDPDHCQFVSLVPRWWARDLLDYLPQSELDAVQRHANRCLVSREVRSEIASAAHFARMLDKRTRLPLVNSLAFSWQMYDRVSQEIQKVEANLYRTIKYGWETNFDSEPMRFSMQQDALDDLIREEVQRYQELTNG